jgi:hypothetical protein
MQQGILMNFDDAAKIIFFSFVALLIGAYIFKSFKYGGFKAAMFGAPINSTIGEVNGAGGKIMSVKVKVHMLGGFPDKAIGLEFVAKSISSYDMMPVTLSISEAKKLAALLHAAVGSNAA